MKVAAALLGNGQLPIAVAAGAVYLILEEWQGRFGEQDHAED